MFGDSGGDDGSAFGSGWSALKGTTGFRAGVTGSLGKGGGKGCLEIRDVRGVVSLLLCSPVELSCLELSFSTGSLNVLENRGVVNFAGPFSFDQVSARIGDALVAAAALFMIVSCILVASFGGSFGGSFDGPASSRLNADMSSFVSGT